MNQLLWRVATILCVITVIAGTPQELRSYHPHYLHSRSYPTPSSIHYYFGRVEGTTPVFLIQKGYEGAESRLFVMDDQQDTARAPGYHLTKNHQRSGQLRAMLVFTIEDTYGDEYLEGARIERVTGNYCYGILLNNGTYTKGFAIRFSRNYETLQLEEAFKDIEISWRNVSVNPKSTWHLSRQLSWFDTRNGEQMPANFIVQDLQNLTAVAIQLSLDQSLLGTLRVHIDEVPLSQNDKSLKFEDFKKIFIENFDKVNKLQAIETKELTCKSDAVDRLRRGLSFEYGSLQLMHGNTPIANNPQSLLSFTPSRKRFPWGFLWDDGFHNQVMIREEPELTLKIIKNWLDTSLDGWIPRQQNRGAEREDLCSCPAFMAKDDRDGNPPSLILALDYLLRNNKLSFEQLGEKVWGKLKEYHAWFMKTQMIGDKSYLFKWFDHIASSGSYNSGLDDFPRPKNGLYHIDAQSWMYKLTKFMWQASVEFKDPHAEIYKQQTQKILEGLQTFLEPQTNLYKDVGSANGTFSEHLGYPSLLPLAFGMIQKNSPEYFATLQALSDQTVFNTLHGISSISQSSPLYLATKNSYWTGPVWINMNYLVIKGLKLFYPEQDDLYTDIRQQVIDTVCGEWKRTGYFFENYIKGGGSFSYPFNGWTSLIALIISEEF